MVFSYHDDQFSKARKLLLLPDRARLSLWKPRGLCRYRCRRENLSERSPVAKTLRGRCIIPGKGEGDVLVTRQPISFAGGLDPKTGRINDPRHELFGVFVSGKVLVFPFGKGSSATSLILLELARLDLGPAAIINLRTEPILAAGSILCKHFYGKEIPILNLNEKKFSMIETGYHAVVDATKGEVILTPAKVP